MERTMIRILLKEDLVYSNVKPLVLGAILSKYLNLPLTIYLNSLQDVPHKVSNLLNTLKISNKYFSITGDAPEYYINQLKSLKYNEDILFQDDSGDYWVDAASIDCEDLYFIDLGQRKKFYISKDQALEISNIKLLNFDGTPSDSLFTVLEDQVENLCVVPKEMANARSTIEEVLLRRFLNIDAQVLYWHTCNSGFYGNNPDTPVKVPVESGYITKCFNDILTKSLEFIGFNLNLEKIYSEIKNEVKV
jgi:hypothetical protein